MESKSNSPIFMFKDNAIVLKNGLRVRENDIINQAIRLANVDLKQNCDVEHIQKVIANLAGCIEVGNCELPIKQYDEISITLKKLLKSQHLEVNVASLRTFAKIIKRPSMRDHWANDVEMILGEIIMCYGLADKEIQQELEEVILDISVAIPIDETINFLDSKLENFDDPSILCALKILHGLIDNQYKEFNDDHLDIVMRHTARIANNDEWKISYIAMRLIAKLYFVMGMGEKKLMLKLALLRLRPNKIERVLHIIKRDKERAKKLQIHQTAMSSHRNFLNMIS